MRLLILAAVAGLALARPETYREKEDFQFSRSSTDEGSKSGYYGAQRGNTGGNYERAHNMDHLAQNQMSGLVRNVEGELGDAAKQPTGSVYTAANSRGVYGSGQYDLSNLGGRSFQEGETHGSQSHSSLTSHYGSASAYKGQSSTSNQAGYGSQLQNAGYGSGHPHDSRYVGYNSAGNSDQTLYSNRHHQASDNLQSARQYEDRVLAQNSGVTAQNSGYYSQAAGYTGQHSQLYDQGSSLTHGSDGYGSNIHTRLVSGTPVRIVIRPGTRVLVPVAAQTYDASQNAATFDQNVINSDTEVLNGNDQHVILKPKAKHYESSYSYRKEWEKQDTKPVGGVVPLAIPTVNPYNTNSELYEDAQAQTLEHQRQSTSGVSSHSRHSSHSGYNVNSATTSQSRQADYNAQLHSSGANIGSSAYQGAYNGGADSAYVGVRSDNNRRTASGAYIGTANAASSLNQIEDSNTKPKSYQSSYSYHKSWERQGDPYIIKPSTNGLYDGQVSEKLTAESLNQGAYGNSHQYGSQRQSHQSYSSHSDADCDENGHVRVARSPHSHHHFDASTQTRGDSEEDLGQQTQQQWDNIADLGQQTQTKWDNIEELGQRTQNTWDKFGQQTENKLDRLQNEGQQTQTLWGQQETQSQFEKIEDFGQQSQSQWDQHDVGQQTQNTWGKLEIEPQRQTELGQQTQDTWTTLETSPNGASPDGPDSSRQDYHGMNIGYQSNANTFEIAQSLNDQKLNAESHTLETSANETSNHHVHSIWDEIKKEEIGQENASSDESDLVQTVDLGQQSQVLWENSNLNENSFNPWHQETEDQVQVGLTNSEHSNTFLDMPNPHPWMYNHAYHHHENSSNSNKYFAHSSSSSLFTGSHSNNWEQENHTITNNKSYNSNVHMNSNGSAFGSSIMGLWDKLDTIEKQTIPSQGNDDKERQDVVQHGTANVFGTQVQHSVFNSHNTDTEQSDGTANNAQRTVFEVHATIKPIQLIIATMTTTKPLTEVIKKDDNAHDIGRGDIGTEDLSNEQSKAGNSKPYKTPEEIEHLSITKETDRRDKHVVELNKNTEDERDLSVMSLDQQNLSEYQDKEEQSKTQSAASSTIINTQNTNHHHIHQNENTHHTNEEMESHDTEQQLENQGSQNLDQQTLVQLMASQENQHKKTDQQFVDFGEQSETLAAEQMEQQFETPNIGQGASFHQENRKHEAEELGQQHEQFDQVSLSRWKPDENFDQQEHKFENWGQENENLEQQSQTGWVENKEDQQLQSAWKPTEEFEQHSHLAEPIAKPMEDLSQQVQTAWKPTEDLQQQTQDTDAFTPQVDQNNENSPTYNKQPEVFEEMIVPQKTSVVVDSPPETESITEKPGFWGKVGNKFTNAKDKVASWFSSSSR